MWARKKKLVACDRYGFLSHCQLLACCPVSYDVVGSLGLLAASAWYAILVANEERLMGFKFHLPVEGFEQHPFFMIWNMGLILWAGMTLMRTANFMRSEFLTTFQQQLFHLPGLIGLTVMGIEFTWALVPQLDPWICLLWLLPMIALLVVQTSYNRNQFSVSRIKNVLPIISEVLVIMYSMVLCILGFGRKRPLTSVSTLVLLAAHQMQKNKMENTNFLGVMLCLSLSNVLYAIALSSGAYDSFSDKLFWDSLLDWDKLIDALNP
ncbi:unnamed protein product [Notodromas monacha]|uniref:Uncharacterized protein n=1 Tax=Notodromas monacha TaxID=399045 RepID=A0A7R9BN64_9CRUS|nr:unnamed protein product [Notodromas monacha]CAG0917220.1 unnamed protein product [Notodromas monacha]